MTAFWMALISVVVGWIISGSVVPAVVMLVSVSMLYLLQLIRFPLNRILIAAGVLLLVTLQAFAFKNGYAGLIYEDLPGIFHIGMGCFLWAWLIVILKDGSRKMVGGWYFSACLTGSVLLFLTAASVEIFRFDPLLIRSLASLPLFLTLWQEYHRNSIASWKKSILPLLITVPLLGALCTASRTTSSQLSKWLKKEEAFTYQLGDDENSATRGSVDLSGGDGIVELPRKANIVVDKETRFYLKVRSIEDFLSLTRRPLYLRTSTVSIFDGNERILPLKKGKWILDGDDGNRDQITTLPERTSNRTLDYAIILPKADANLIPLIEGTNRVRADEVFHYSEGRYQLGQETVSEWLRFSAIGPRDDRLPELGRIDRKKTDQAHLSLPNTDLARRIQSLTKQIATGNSPETEVSDYIQERCRYSLKYRNPKNLSPVENLLFGERKGHCELFATATVMMLRSAGVPSRIAYGYTGGASNSDQLAIAFRGSDIHAWAEILNEDGEWRIFDTTPSDRGAERISRSSGDGNIDWKMASFNPEAGMAVTDEDAGPKSWLANISASISDWASSYFFALLSGVIAVVTLGKWSISRWLRRKSPGYTLPSAEFNSSRADPYLPRPEFIDALLNLGEKSGVPRIPGNTLREYVNLLLIQGIGYVDLNEAVEYFYETRYGTGEVNHSLERRFLKRIREYEKG